MATGRLYSVQFNNASVSAQQDLFEINAPADGVVELLEVHLSQSTEVGDAMEEGLSILIKTGATTSGNGTVTTAVARQLGDPAFGGTAEVNGTTKATAGTIVTHEAYAWNVRVPLDIIWQPESRILISPSARLTVELATTPGDVMTMNGFAIFKEIGG